MHKRIDELNSFKKRVLLRLDLNVPIQAGQILDHTRIKASIPTIQHLLKQNAKIIILTHLGRPQGTEDPNYSTRRLRESLSKHLAHDVTQLNNCIGDTVKARIHKMQAKEILLLENLRFHKGEEANDPLFSKALAQLGELYINDAFGTSHRAHASIIGIPAHLPSATGFLMEREIHYLTNLFKAVKRPFMILIGGSKISDKILCLDSLIKEADILAIGGAMAYTFLQGAGHGTGSSKIERSAVELAKRLLERCRTQKLEVLLPHDHITTTRLPSGTIHTITGEIPQGHFGADIGPQSIKAIQDAIHRSRTVFWNGPLGITETPPFHRGTQCIAKSLTESNITSIIGGGDVVAAIQQSCNTEGITHLSTGGGACIKFLESCSLIGIEALERKE